jgi:hypothetical protein
MILRKTLGPASSLLLLFALAPTGCAQQQQPAAGKPAQQQPAQGQQAAQPQQPPSAPQTHLKVGDAAPDFTLRDTAGKEVKLSDFRGNKSVVLAFYVLAFTGG